MKTYHKILGTLFIISIFGFGCSTQNKTIKSNSHYEEEKKTALNLEPDSIIEFNEEIEPLEYEAIVEEHQYQESVEEIISENEQIHILSVETETSYGIPVRKYLTPTETTNFNYGAYGYLVFTHRPNENENSRYIEICEAYIRNFEPYDSYLDNVTQDIMVTFWMVLEGYLDEDNSTDCKTNIDYYDYVQAKKIAGSINKLSSKGPILVAWNQPFDSVKNYDEALILDMSKFSNDDIDRAFRIWMEQITLDPELWNDGFNLKKIKESFRNFLENYGDSILSAMQTLKIFNE